MGCLSLRFLKTGYSRSPKIKVMTTEGKCFKYVAPIIVKEVLMDYPLHALLDSETVRKHGNRARPLQGTLFLEPGHLYFLIPQSSHQRPGTTSSFTSSSSKAAKECSTRTRKVSFAETHTESLASTKSLNCVGSMESMQPDRRESSAVEILPSPCDGVIRLKVVVSKRKLASVLNEGGDCVSMVEGFLSPLLQTSRGDPQSALASSSDDPSSSCSWRPSLESIPESAHETLPEEP